MGVAKRARQFRGRASKRCSKSTKGRCLGVIREIGGRVMQEQSTLLNNSLNEFCRSAHTPQMNQINTEQQLSFCQNEHRRPPLTPFLTSIENFFSFVRFKRPLLLECESV